MDSKVFISYSDHAGKYSATRDEFVDNLKNADVPVWYDKEDIQVGDKWLTRITEGLGYCYAGVLLLSREALASEFVKYEVSCLLQRTRCHAGFKLFALLLDDIEIDDVKTGFFEAVRIPDEQFGGFDEKWPVVIDKLKSVRPPALTPIRELEDHVYQFLRDVALTALRSVADDRGWEQFRDLGKEAEVLHFVRTLVAEPLEDQLSVLHRIKNGLPAGCNVVKLFDTMAPSWVNEQAALQLAGVREADPEKRGAIINGTLPDFTVEMFLRRAMPIADVRILKMPSHVPRGRRPEHRIAKGIREALRRDLDLRLEAHATPEEVEKAVNAKLDKYQNLGVLPVHKLLLDPIELGLVERLQSRFPRVTFVAMTNKEVPAEIIDPLAGRIAVVQPSLSTAETEKFHNETYAFDWYEERYGALNERRPTVENSNDATL